VIVTRTSFAAVAFVLAASGAQAQETLPQTARPTQPPAGSPASMSPEKIQRIYLIRQYETVLTNAVKTGANSLANTMKLADPTSMFVAGNARARGFELDGYGIMFDVDVPTMLQSVVWSSQMLQRQQDIDKLNEIIADPRTPENTRRMAESERRRYDRMNQQALPGVPTPLAAVPQGLAVAQTTDAPAGANATLREAAAAPAPDPRTPDEMYTDVIRGALIEAMLSFGPALRLADDEWLTVAARATAPGVSNQLDDSSSILIRIKGVDLTAFISGKISRDAVLKKIEIKEG
jgi:hypothetical protein